VGDDAFRGLSRESESDHDLDGHDRALGVDDET
jgi:hypothetical protein